MSKSNSVGGDWSSGESVPEVLLKRQTWTAGDMDDPARQSSREERNRVGGGDG